MYVDSLQWKWGLYVLYVIIVSHFTIKFQAPTFRISRPKGPQLSGGRYFQVAVTFGWLKYVIN